MTRIIILFGVIVAIIVTPLIVFYIWFPVSLGRFVGLVENVIAGIIGGVLITIALDVILRNRQQKSIDKVARVGISETSAQVNRLTALFASMVKAASDGFMPSDFTSLFGIESAKLISLRLGLNKKAPDRSNATWKQYITSEIKIILAQLREISHQYQVCFSEDVSTAIAGIYNSTLLNAMRKLESALRPNIEQRIEYPVINIPIETLEPLLKDIARCVETVHRYALRLNARIQVNFPTETFRDDVSPKLGDARYVGKPGPPMLIGDRFPPRERMVQVDGARWIQEE